MSRRMRLVGFLASIAFLGLSLAAAIAQDVDLTADSTTVVAITNNAACANNQCGTLYQPSHSSCPNNGRCNYSGLSQPLICYSNPDADCNTSQANIDNGKTESCPGTCATGGGSCPGSWYRCSSTSWHIP